MAVTLNEISKWLDANKIGHHVNDEELKILLGLSNGKTKKAVTIDLKEDGEMFQIYLNLLIDDKGTVLKINENEHKAQILQYILKLNYDQKFGTWEFDPEDGEIRFAVEIPLEDAKMTKKQFYRIFGHVGQGGQDGFDNILKIMKTGEFPNDNTEELFNSYLKMMMLEKLKEEIGEDPELSVLLDRLGEKSAEDDETGI